MAHDGKPTYKTGWRHSLRVEVDKVAMLKHEFKAAQAFANGREGCSDGTDRVYVRRSGDDVWIVSGDDGTFRVAKLPQEAVDVLLWSEQRGYAYPTEWSFPKGLKWQDVMEFPNAQYVFEDKGDSVSFQVGRFVMRLRQSWVLPCDLGAIMPDPDDVPQTVAFTPEVLAAMTRWVAATSENRGMGATHRTFRQAWIDKQIEQHKAALRKQGLSDDVEFDPRAPEHWEGLIEFLLANRPLIDSLGDIGDTIKALNRVTNPIIRYGKGAVAVVTGDELVWYTLARNV